MAGGPSEYGQTLIHRTIPAMARGPSEYALIQC